MALTYGFYNSSNGDRKYNAEDFSEIFNGIINDGIFQSVGTAFVVKASDGLFVDVGIGRAWFNGTWTLNDSIMSLEAPDADLLYDRIDAVVLEVNKTSRVNSIKFVQGEAKTNPNNPALTKTTYLKQYPLCYISRKANSTTINQADILNKVGSTDTPFVTGILKTISLNELLGQWEDELNTFVGNKETEVNTWFNNKKIEYDNWLALTQNDYNEWIEEKQTNYDNWISTNQAEFLAWYERMQSILDESIAVNLQNQIDDGFAYSSGFIESTTVFNSDGSIVETFPDHTETTTFNSDGSITAVLSHEDGRLITKNTKFNSDGSITNTVTESSLGGA